MPILSSLISEPILIINNAMFSCAQKMLGEGGAIMRDIKDGKMGT